MSSVVGGVVWLARLGMHLRGERACAKPLSSLNECSGCRRLSGGCGRWSGGCAALARERQGNEWGEVLALSV